MVALRKWLALVFGVCFATIGHAQIGAEIAQQHAQRAGDRLAALTSLRAEGRITIAGETVAVVTLAQRPNRLRVETSTPARRVVQGTDGVNPPWISHTDTKGGVPQDMNEADARDFAESADFDGVLVDYAKKGYSVDYAGEEMIQERKAAKLLVMGPRDEIFFLWLDAQSHEIVKRLVYRTRGDRRISIETLFKDFRPVGGVLQPHRIETSANGETIYVMVLEKMEANPIVAPGIFSKP